MTPTGNDMEQRFRTHSPVSKTVTAYDRQCFKLYLMIINAGNAGTKWEEAYAQVFGNEVGSDHQKARTQYYSHLKRARWMTTNGYRLLLKG